MRFIVLTALQFIVMYSIAQHKLDVYVFLAEECPISIYMCPALLDLTKEHGHNVSFHAVFPKYNSTQASADSFLMQHGLEEYNVLLDPFQEISRKYEATITPEAVIVDDKGIIKYRGRVSNAYRAPGKMNHGKRKNDVDEVLDALKNQSEYSKPWPTAVGCYISFHKS